MLNSVRLSLLLACTAVCTAPGLLPVAGFPQILLGSMVIQAASGCKKGTGHSRGPESGWRPGLTTPQEGMGSAIPYALAWGPKQWDTPFWRIRPFHLRSRVLQPYY